MDELNVIIIVLNILLVLFSGFNLLLDLIKFIITNRKKK